MKQISSTKDRILDNPYAFKIVRYLFGGHKNTMGIIKKELSNTKNKKVLDVGCGLGNYSEIVDGYYVGADMNKHFVNFASEKYDKRFVVFDATRMCFKSKSFDKAIFISMLHHFPDSKNEMVLKEISRVTKGDVLILDLDPSTKNPLIKFFYRMDRGEHIRPAEKQVALISRHLKIKKHLSFVSGTSLHSLFVCSSK